MKKDLYDGFPRVLLLTHVSQYTTVREIHAGPLKIIHHVPRLLQVLTGTMIERFSLVVFIFLKMYRNSCHIPCLATYLCPREIGTKPEKLCSTSEMVTDGDEDTGS